MNGIEVFTGCVVRLEDRRPYENIEKLNPLGSLGPFVPDTLNQEVKVAGDIDVTLHRLRRTELRFGMTGPEHGTHLSPTEPQKVLGSLG